MVTEGLITNVVTVVLILVLLGTVLLPKKVRYAFNSVIILSFGIVPLLYDLGISPVTFGQAGIISYVMAGVVVFTAQSLISEGFHEEHALKYVNIVIGIVIISLALIPTLYSLGALTFTLPDYPHIVDQIMYIVAGILLFIGLFLSRE